MYKHPGRAGVELTDEMVEAGKLELMGHCESTEVWDYADVIVPAIFRAMLACLPAPISGSPELPLEANRFEA